MSFSSQTRDTSTCTDRCSMMFLTLIKAWFEKSKELLTLCLSNRALSRCVLSISSLWKGNLINIELPLLLITWWIAMEFVTFVHSVSKHVTVGAQGSFLLRSSLVTRIPFGINIHGYRIRFRNVCSTITMTNSFMCLLLKNQGVHLAHWWKWLKHENVTPHSLKIFIEPH